MTLTVDRILVIAATARELAEPRGWRVLECGVGPVDSAVATAAAIASLRPAAIVHVGIAGARRAAAIEPPALIIGESSQYCDLEVPEVWAPRLLEPPVALLEAARRALPAALLRSIGTSGRVGGTARCDVEGMEGFGVLRAAQIAGVPAIEVRAISNQIEEQDRARWQFDAAFAAIVAATPLLVDEVLQCGL